LEKNMSAERKSPVVPVPAVLAVVARRGRVLLVRRANPPDQGRWGFPGGRIEPGETLAAAALRELAEETGVVAESGAVLGAFDSVHDGADGRLAHHYVLVAVGCRWVSGDGAAADDALDTGWFTPEEIAALDEAASRDVGRLAALALVSTGAPPAAGGAG
jgi:ADP-ribose pyrophosphatase YjhB (NUDIX family)